VKPEVAAAQEAATKTGGAAATTDASYPEGSVLADTGTIVDTAANASAPAATPNASLSAREQRYQELLRSSPPAPVQLPTPPKPAAEKPSFLKRVANAIGLGDDKEKKPTGPAPRAPVPPRPSQQQAGNQQSNQNQQQADNKPKDPGKPAEEADPESDTRAPQLIGLEFMPRQVQDGETTTLTITAQDDLSGIRTISGVIANPSGATANGFAAQRELETNRFVAKVVVPKDAAEGNWHIKYLTMTDNASNSVSLAYGQQLAPAIATFQVRSSRSDAKGPDLKDIWIERRDMSAGEKNTVFVQAEDDKAGVHIISGVFVSPSKQARIGFGCKEGASAWECSINVPQCVDCGVWQLEQIQLQDKANNTTTVRVDSPVVQKIQVAIAGTQCDGQAPVLTGLALSPPVVSNAEQSIISVTATVQDDNCGGATLSGLVTGPSGQRLNILFDPSKDGQNFTGRIEVKPHTAKGTYVVAWIQALDKGQNLKAYSSTDPIVGRVTFRIE
jgi:hypothetical protein